MSKKIKVDANPAKGGLIDWEIDGQKAKESKIQFQKGDSNVEVEFMLRDRTDHRLRFDTRTPIWVHENEHGQCPPNGATDAQIQVLSCDDNKLTLINRNAKESTLRYQLNFVDDGNNAAPCDPEFKNGGTNIR